MKTVALCFYSCEKKKKQQDIRHCIKKQQQPKILRKYYYLLTFLTGFVKNVIFYHLSLYLLTVVKNMYDHIIYAT